MSPDESLSFATTLMKAGSATFEGLDLHDVDVEIEFVSKEGFAAAGDRTGVVVLETTLDDELRELGFARELLNRVQTMRKEMKLEYTDRIALAILGSARVAKIVEATRDKLCAEVLAVDLSTTAAPAGATSGEFDVQGDGEMVTIAIARA